MSVVEPFPTAAVAAIGRHGWIEGDLLASLVDRVRFLHRPVHDAITVAAWISALRRISSSAEAAAQAYEDTLTSYNFVQRVGDPELPSIAGAHPLVREAFERLLAIGRAAAEATS